MREHFENCSDALDAVEASLRTRHRAPAGALLKIAIDSSKETPQFICGQCLFSDEVVDGSGQLDYGDLVLASEWIPNGEVISRLRTVLAGSLAIAAHDFNIAFRNAHARQYYQDDRGASGWPELRVTCSGPRAGQPNRKLDPVVRIGLPPYRSWEEAVRTWVYGDAFREYTGIPDADDLVIVIPDTRGRILATKWKPPHLSIETELASLPTDVELQVLASLPDRDLRTTHPASSGTLDVELDEQAKRVAIYLVHEPRELLDFVELSYLRTHSEREPLEPTEKRADEDLSAGESDQVEYKVFIEPQDGKWSEVVRSVVAFANTGGGRIYLGVRDDGSLEGEARLRKTGKGNLEDAAAAILGSVRKVLSDRVKPNAPCRVELIEVRGQPVIAVLVERGRRSPYATDQNEIFVRKGASNLRPDPTSELPQLLNGREWMNSDDDFLT